MQSSMWKCVGCEEDNTIERSTCYSCQSMKPKKVYSPRPHTSESPNNRDWICLQCTTNNSWKRTISCVVCHAPRVAVGHIPDVESIWICTSCNKSNIATMEHCYFCKQGKNTEPHLETGAEDQLQSKRPGDWTCIICNFDNFGRRNECFKCNSSRNTSQSGTAAEILETKDAKSWKCESCSFVNKPNQLYHCFQCGSPRNHTVRPRRDNWNCESCGTINFALRNTCYACFPQTKREREDFFNASKKPRIQPIHGKEIPHLMAPYNHRENNHRPNDMGVISKPENPSLQNDPAALPRTVNITYRLTPQDWACQSCDTPNIALRNFCKDCDTPRKEIAKHYVQYKKQGISALAGLPISDPNSQGLISSPSSNPAALSNQRMMSTNRNQAKTAPISNSGHRNHCSKQNNPHILPTPGVGPPRTSVPAPDECVVCARCNTTNYSNRSHCLKCSSLLSDSSVPVKNELTWQCQYCDSFVAVSTDYCPMCRQHRGAFQTDQNSYEPEEGTDERSYEEITRHQFPDPRDTPQNIDHVTNHVSSRPGYITEDSYYKY